MTFRFSCDDHLASQPGQQYLFIFVISCLNWTTNFVCCPFFFIEWMSEPLCLLKWPYLKGMVLIACEIEAKPKTTLSSSTAMCLRGLFGLIDDELNLRGNSRLTQHKHKARAAKTEETNGRIFKATLCRRRRRLGRRQIERISQN